MVRFTAGIFMFMKGIEAQSFTVATTRLSNLLNHFSSLDCFETSGPHVILTQSCHAFKAYLSLRLNIGYAVAESSVVAVVCGHIHHWRGYVFDIAWILGVSLRFAPEQLPMAIIWKSKLQIKPFDSGCSTTEARRTTRMSLLQSRRRS